MIRLKLPLKPLRHNQEGFLLPALLSFIIAMGILSGAVLETILNNYTIVNNSVTSQKAFNIAEAGVNYYLWHLSHNATDFKDGQSTPATPDPNLGYGPYVHNYVDANAITEGTYTLYIKPQSTGSTIATVRAIGKVTGSNITRTIEAQIGAPSFASYAVVNDSALWFGNNESADGPVESNQGVEMDGPSNSEISSPNATYVPPDNAHSTNYPNNQSHPGVWCDASVTTPTNCNTRDKSNWVYPVPSVDFNLVTSSLCTMKKVAFTDYPATSALATQSTACSQTPTTRTNAYIPQQSTSFSASKGYLVRLNANGTYDLYKVTGENDTKTSYTAALGLSSTACSTPTWVACGVALPPSGVIFVEDNVWVLSNPTFHGRVTIAAGRLATNNSTDITIAGPLVYSTKNGNDAIGLVTEDTVELAPYAPPASGSFNFEVDAAVLAQTGNVWFPQSYRSNNNADTPLWNNSNQTFLFYGSVATRQTWTWTWCSGNPCTTTNGIAHNTTQYDYNLQYAPPPSYPITGGYNILSWREILTKP